MDVNGISLEIKESKAARLYISIQIANPNDVSATVDSMSYTGYIDQDKYLEGNLKKHLEIEPFDTIFLTLPNDFDFIKHEQKISKSETDSGTYRFTFNIFASALGFKNIKVPYLYEKKVALFKIPDFKIETLHIRKPGLKNIAMEAEISLFNKSMLDMISIEDYYEFYVEDELWAKGEIPGEIRLNKKSYASIKADFEVDPGKVIKTTGILGQKDYRDKKFHAIMRSSLKIKKKDIGYKEIKVLLNFEDKLGALMEKVKEDKSNKKK